MIRGISCRLAVLDVLKALRQITTDKRHWQKIPRLNYQIPLKWTKSIKSCFSPTSSELSLTNPVSERERGKQRAEEVHFVLHPE